MSEKRFKLDFDNHSQGAIMDRQDKYGQYCRLYDFGEVGRQQIVDLLNEQQEFIEELQVSESMGWGRAERFEKKCPKELHNKKMYIKRLEYKVQYFKDENNKLKEQLKEKEEEEKQYAKEILRLNELNKQIDRFHRLQGGY